MKPLVDTVASVLEGASIADARAEASRIVQVAAAGAPDAPEGVARSMAERRALGVPLAYVLGRATFMGVELIAAEGALVPREETELLGETAIGELRASAAPRIVDMCCGSGNLACALAHHLPAARIWGSDLTDVCVSLARRNTEHVGVADRVTIVQGDLFSGLCNSGLEGTVDVVVCNPPYISQGKLAAGQAGLLEHEPREAFDGGPYGLSIHQRVIKGALPFLRPGGVLMFEIGAGQERQVRALFERAGAYVGIVGVTDSNGEVRVVSGRTGV